LSDQVLSEPERLGLNALRVLAIDMIEAARSGHPGMPMGAAPMAYVLFTRVMRYDPRAPKWWNRDRFVLSGGHASALLYAALHMAGFDLPLEELKRFRQFGSRTPGHPEYGLTPGVEAMTGPLGQGFATAIGMALAEAHLAARYNRPDLPIVDHYTYVLASDGDLMEGISYEAASLAGHLGLGKLIVLYDSNEVSLDGPLARAFSEDIRGRFVAQGWQYLRVEDGESVESIEAAIREAQSETRRPSLIEVKTVIGRGAPKLQGTHKAHGAPLGSEEAARAKEYYGWTWEPFEVPEVAYDPYRNAAARGAETRYAWEKLLERYRAEHPALYETFCEQMEGRLPAEWEESLPRFTPGEGLATRQASGTVLNALAARVPAIFGGSADLSSSNNTYLKDQGDVTRENAAGRNIWFGVREHAMGAVLNGLALHGGVRPFGGTFLVFSDYLRPAIRVSALSHLPVLYVFTHDSIAVGEDGPTHQPIEHLASLRAMPNLVVIRPADANEVRAAYAAWFARTDGPTALILTRQKLPVLKETERRAWEGVSRGGYILYENTPGELPELLWIATGSEVPLALEAAKELASRGRRVRVVSMPSRDLFLLQDEVYRETVLPSSVSKRIAVEMASPFGWGDFVGLEGRVIGVDRFGASAPGEVVVREYGFTVESLVAEAEDFLKS